MNTNINSSVPEDLCSIACTCKLLNDVSCRDETWVELLNVSTFSSLEEFWKSTLGARTNNDSRLEESIPQVD